MMDGRLFRMVGMIAAALCLLRGLAVFASDHTEVYSAAEGDRESADFDSAKDEDGEEVGRAEVRLSRPDEAASRIADQEGYEMVPGAEKWMKGSHGPSGDTLIVPKKMGRAIATEPSTAESPLKAEVMEPAALTQAERPSYGLKSEPAPETRIEPPLPERSVAARSGVQEVSIIASDYGYFPNHVFVTQNIPVKIYLSTPSKNTLCFMLDDFGLRKGISPGKVEELTFTPDGQRTDYRFYCPIKSIEGRISVRQAPLAEQPGRAVAEEKKPEITAGKRNEPNNAGQLRALVEEE